MHLEKLPPHAQQAVKDLVEDQQFQARFAKDQTLDYLDSLKRDKQIQFFQTQLAISKKIKLFNNELNPLTMALYSYLYTIKSPIVFDLEKVTMIDIDLFFYLLQTKDFNSEMKTVLVNSMNYSKLKMNLEQDEAIKLFEKLYKIEFRCLNLFPKTNEQKEPLFNVDWMTSLASKVKPLTSYSTEELYTYVSLSEIFYYFANYCRMQGDQSIYIRTEDEILFEQDKRICELIVDRLIEKGVLTAEERENTLKQIIQEKD